MTQEINWSQKIGEALQEDNENHEEHDEDTNDGVFHASWLGYCQRNILLSKQGIKENDAESLGRFMTGTLIHEFMENEVSDFLPDHVESEEAIPEVEQGDLTFVGTADAVDHENEVIYDFKTRASWYRFEPPIDRHLDQLQIYMEAFGYDKAKVIYISKGDMEVKTWPEEEGEFIERDSSSYYQLVAKAYEVYDFIQNHGGIDSIEQLNEAFKPCDNFFCGDEKLSIDTSQGEESEEETEDGE